MQAQSMVLCMHHTTEAMLCWHLRGPCSHDQEPYRSLEEPEDSKLHAFCLA